MDLLRLGVLSLVFLGLVVTGEAAQITVGQTLTNQKFEWKSNYSDRSLGSYGQYQVALTSGTTYEIFTSNPTGGNTQDTYLYLLDSSGAIVAQDDDSAGGLQAKIVYSPTATGTFNVRLRAYDQGTYGFCSLTVKTKATPPPTPKITVAPGDTLLDQYFGWQDAFANRQDGAYASYGIAMATDQTYTIQTSNAYGGNTTDTYLYLLNSTGTIAASDDDSGGNLYSKIIFHPAAAGTFTIKLRAYSKGTNAYCTLKVTSASQGAGVPLLPDLITWKKPGSYLYDALIQTSGGQTQLRFSNAVANIGAAAMELYGVVQPDGTTYAYQRVWNDNGTYTDRLAGTFMFDGHQGHNHWHFADFADYNLRSVTAGGGVGPVLATSQKVTFCLEDVTQYDGTTVGPAGTGSYSCSNQGISVGWADVYSQDLSGQLIDIGGVPNGTYWLESVADPSNRLEELNKTNNAARIKITIDKAAGTVTVLE